MESHANPTYYNHKYLWVLKFAQEVSIPSAEAAALVGNIGGNFDTLNSHRMACRIAVKGYVVMSPRKFYEALGQVYKPFATEENDKMVWGMEFCKRVNKYIFLRLV